MFDRGTAAVHPIWSYVSELALRTRPPRVPYGERLQVAALFADVAGFTRLTARLASFGPRGAELLTSHLNNCFGSLIEVVDQYGGEIYRFAGDALLAVWPVSEDASLANQTTQAAECALAIQQAMRNYRLPDDEPLHVRVGVSSGEMLAAHLGGVGGRIEFLLAGEAFEQLGAAARAAGPGEVVLSPAAARLVSPELRVHATSDGARLVGPPRLRDQNQVDRAPVDPTAFEPREYVLPTVLARLDVDQSDWIPELRRVTTVFFNIDDVDTTGPDALDRLQAIVVAVQDTLARYEGSLCQLVMADKGLVLLCPFGLPPDAHEDDAARALLAALDTRTALSGMGLHVSAGVATGRVFCGPIGNARRRDYNLMGDAVNLAALLAVEAQDAVHCDAATVQSAYERLDFEALGASELKGHEQAVERFRCLGPRSSGGTEPPTRRTSVIGRTTERAAIFESLQRLRSQAEGGALVIEGEPGVGKSRLLMDLVDQAMLVGVRCLQSAGDSIDSATPYFAWRGVFAQLLGPPASISPTSLLAEMAVRPEAVGYQTFDVSEQMLPLLNQVLRLDLAENVSTQSMSGEARADYTREMLLRFLEHAAEQGPLVVVLDDAQWLDSASWSLARFVLDRLPVLLVLGTRTIRQEPPADFQLILDRPRTLRLLMSNLSYQDSVELACRCLDVDTLPEPLAALLWDRTEGHPLYVQELAFALRDTGAIHIDGRACYLDASVAGAEPGSLPDTLHAAITTRIDRLTPQQQLVLKVASVLGRQFSDAALHGIFPTPGDDELASYVRELQSLDLLQPAYGGAEPTYAFSHVLIQDVAYNLMLFAQRQQLHRAVAEWYEQRFADDLNPYVTILAYHWRRAISSPRDDPGIARVAIDYLDKAGQQALIHYANAETITFYEDALRLEAELSRETGVSVVSLSRRAQWKRHLGDAYFRVGRLPDAIARLRDALADLGYTASTQKLPLALGIVADAARQILRQTVPQRFAPSTNPATRAELEHVAEIYASLSLYTFITMDELASVGALLRGHNLAEKAGPTGVLLRTSYQMSTFTALLFARPTLFEHYIGRANAIAREIHAPASEAEMWFGGAGLYRTVQGRWAEADAATGEAQRLFMELGDRRWTELSMYQRSNIAMLHGDFERSRDLTAEALLSAERRGDAQSQAWLLIQQAHAEVVHGNYEAALGCLQQTQARLTGSHVTLSDPAALLWSDATKSLALALSGDVGAAQAVAEEACARIKPYLNFMYYAIRGFGNLAEAALILWQSAPGSTKLRDLAHKSVEATRQFARSSPFGRPQALLWQGWYQACSGQNQRAVQTWRSSVTAAEELQMPNEEALAHAFLGRYLVDSTAEREAHLQRARDLFTHYGLHFSPADPFQPTP